MKSLFKKIFCVVTFLMLVIKLQAQEKKTTFRIVGYYPFNTAMTADTGEVPFDKLTHIDLAFVNPDKDGNFNQDFDALKPFIAAAHHHDVKVLISIGGGASPQQYHRLLKKDKRMKLVKAFIKIVEKYNIDGIDVDLEAGYAFGKKTDSNYAPFVIELSKRLKESNTLITAALPGSKPGNVVTQKVLNQFDFINIMSYDHTGPWAPERKGPHASYAQSLDDLHGYLHELHIPKAKLVLGVPFYGHGFGPGLHDPVIGWMKYKDIVSEYPGAEWVDHWHLPNGYIVYYNGIPTIKNKTRLAKKEAGGMMIWELNYDVTSGKKSLLNAIYQAAHEDYPRL